MLPTRKDLARQALLKAEEIRDKYDIEPESAVNIFDLCGERLDPPVLVRFSDIKSMEGFYLRQEKPEIWLGERPLVRRTFNCAHELGHHVFGHGSTMDELTAEGESGRSFDPKEFLVDTFAGSLLMPRIAVARRVPTPGLASRKRRRRAVFHRGLQPGRRLRDAGEPLLL